MATNKSWITNHANIDTLAKTNWEYRKRMGNIKIRQAIPVIKAVRQNKAPNNL